MVQLSLHLTKIQGPFQIEEHHEKFSDWVTIQHQQARIPIYLENAQAAQIVATALQQALNCAPAETYESLQTELEQLQLRIKAICTKIDEIEYNEAKAAMTPKEDDSDISF